MEDEDIRAAVERTGEIHLAFSPRLVQFQTPEGMKFDEIYRRVLGLFSISEAEIFPIFRVYPRFGPDRFAELVDGFLKKGGELRIYMHDFSMRPLRRVDLERIRLEGPKSMRSPAYRCALLGSIRAENGGYLLNGRIRLGDREALGRWLEACLYSLWVEPALTPDIAESLAEAVADFVRESRRRAAETLRRALGERAAEELRRKGCLTLKSRNGRVYRIDAFGRVFDVLAGRPVCVVVDGEAELPPEDRVLAKYLVVRDHPEQVTTLQEAVDGSLGRCSRCGSEIGPEEQYVAITRQLEIFTGGVRPAPETPHYDVVLVREHHRRGQQWPEVEVLDAEVIATLCTRCHRALERAGIFDRIEALLSGFGPRGGRRI